jgi:SAM-dependent methyltransferase
MSWWFANEAVGMSGAGDASPAHGKVGTSVTRETETLLEMVAGAVGRRPPRVLQVGSRTLVSDRNVRNWRNLVARRFGRADFVGMDIEQGANVDRVLDICSPVSRLRAGLGEEPFDLVLCCHVLEHAHAPWRAARNIEALLRPGGVAFVSAAWSQAFHATPDDLWRFSVRGLMRLFGRLEVVSAFYSGGDVGLDVAYRVVRGDKPELEPRSGAVEQGLFQLVLDHEDNRAVLARQATERLPVSRTYLPTLFVNVVGKRSR